MGEEQAHIIRQIVGLSEISDHYDVILCDIWGVLHNGVASFTQASDALVLFRRRGGAVILISNAPRPSPADRAASSEAWSFAGRIRCNRHVGRRHDWIDGDCRPATQSSTSGRSVT